MHVRGRYGLARPSALLAAAVTAVCLCLSCERASLTAPTSSVITVQASQDVLNLNGSAQIVARVIELSGTPAHNGTLVTFTTTLGALEPTESLTRNGQAVVTLRAGSRSGIAEVSAFSGGARSEPVMITIGGAAAASIVVTASPGTVPAGGGAVTLSARPTDASGNVLPGVPVRFSADAGTLSASTAISDALGEARTTLTTDRDTVATVSVGAQSATVTIRVNVPPTVTIAATGTFPTIGTPTVFAVTVAAGSSAIREVTIAFGDGTSRSLGALTGSTNVTHTYPDAGTFNVVAAATDTSGEVVSVATVLVVEGGEPLNVSITAAPPTAQAGDAVALTATVTQSTGTPAIDRYEWSFGDGSNAVTTGSATNHVYRRAGRYVVNVRAVERDGRTGAGRIEVDITPRSPLNVNLTARPSPATVDDVVTFTATVSGSSVPIARFEWDFDDGTHATTTGPVVNHVYSEAGTRTVEVTVYSVEGDRGSTQTTVIVIPLQIEVTLTVNPLTANAGQRVTFTATVSPATVVIVRYDWDFGDAGGNTASTTGRTTTFAYGAMDKGTTRTVTVTAVAFDGTTVSTQGLVSINP